MKTRDILVLGMLSLSATALTVACGDDSSDGGSAGGGGDGGAATGGTSSGGSETGGGGGEEGGALDCAAVCDEVASEGCLGPTLGPEICGAVCTLSGAVCQTEEQAVLGCSDDPPVAACGMTGVSLEGCSGDEAQAWLECLDDARPGGGGGMGGMGGMPG